jgi:hypothetical protein
VADRALQTCAYDNYVRALAQYDIFVAEHAATGCRLITVTARAKHMAQEQLG